MVVKKERKKEREVSFFGPSLFAKRLFFFFFSLLFLFIKNKKNKKTLSPLTQNVHPGARDVVNGPQEPPVDSVVGDPVVADVARERGRGHGRGLASGGGHRRVKGGGPGVPALHPVRLVRRALVERLEVEGHADRVEPKSADPPDHRAEVARLRVGSRIKIRKHLVGVVEAEPADAFEVRSTGDDAVGRRKSGGGREDG